MIKASALYIVIVISLVIAVLCSSLIITAYYYRAEYQKKFRYDQLKSNLESGINILLTTSDSTYNREKIFSLFNQDNDTVSLQKITWGIYDVCIARSFIQQDTLYKTFAVANPIDSSKWAALYIIDEDRPISVSGKTTIHGNAYVPKAGIQQAYVDNKAYTGDKRIVIGHKYLSAKKLPSLDDKRLKALNPYFTAKGDVFPDNDSIQRSFLKPTKVFDFQKEVQIISHTLLKGNIILHSDTTLTIDSTTRLENVLVFAKTIIVKSGFAGNCQLFATDSVSVGRNCRFDYPSCMGVIRYNAVKSKSQAKVSIGENSIVNGQIFSYDGSPDNLKPLINIGKKDTVRGQVYSQGILQFNDKTVVHGSVFTSNFLYKSVFTLYENYLINVTLDSKELSAYYLSSEAIPVATKKKKVLKWLEGN